MITQMMGSRNPRIEIRTSLDGIIMTPEQIAEADRKVKPTTVPPAPFVPPQGNTQPIVDPTTIPPGTAEKKKDYIYVPALGLYVSENRYLQSKNWNDTQEILHKEGRRMPTIPEFVELLKYLRSNDGKSKVKNAQKILDEIYKVAGNWRSEWLDAKFEEKKGMYVSYHVFDSKGKIIQKQEKLETYLTDDKTPGIDLDSWLASPTKQGLPNSTCPDGQLYYWYPRNGKVARFDAYSGGAILGCIGGATDTDPSLGVRYVEPRSGETAKKK